MSIHKNRRKVEVCHNCHHILKPEDNFCANCGQENHDLKVGVGQLLYDVFEGITNFDTKFYNTAKSIFSQPGKITKDFLEGRRARYVPPIRLYFIVSFVFFIAFDELVEMGLNSTNDFARGVIDSLSGDSKRADKNEDDEEESNKKEDNSIQNQAIKAIAEKREEKNKEITSLNIELDSAIANQDTSLQYTLEKKIERNEKQIKTFNKQIKLASQAKGFIDYVTNFDIAAYEILDEMNVDRDDTLRVIIDSLPEYKQRPVLIEIQKQLALDSVHTEAIKEPAEDLKAYFTERMGKKGKIEYTLILHSLKNNVKVPLWIEGVKVIAKSSDGSLQNRTYKKRLLEMSNDELDSLIVKEEKGKSTLAFLKRGLRRNVTYYELAFDEDAEKAIGEMVHFGVNVISFMMFILMPLVALMLKISYSKRIHSAIWYPFKWVKYLFRLLKYALTGGFMRQKPFPEMPKLFEGQTRFYYEHLIFSIHIHSIFMLMLMIFIGIGIIVGHWNIALSIALIVFMIYFAMSLKVVYRQSWLKTIWKSMVLFCMYCFTFTMVLGITGAIKFALQ
ncbi:DUF3667 domain-containing protein [Flectobacillus sp. DC10W]|jgi:hypothetical protein|uniref:DUF3667 domain-containing protein n=1 Tax=Flectobacillus longus TaxID=2984207 RepID=A0ABT6YRB8_9BACT|nr:DUF3667 domain-containing protein [Flectobacillus longus]MDI9865721.1 DUF3667 domain-containing protein [Flectobacillus longus]